MTSSDTIFTELRETDSPYRLDCSLGKLEVAEVLVYRPGQLHTAGDDPDKRDDPAGVPRPDHRLVRVEYREVSESVKEIILSSGHIILEMHPCNKEMSER